MQNVIFALLATGVRDYCWSVILARCSGLCACRVIYRLQKGEYSPSKEPRNRLYGQQAVNACYGIVQHNTGAAA
jgi:hypothetical protein